jgi:DNA-binding CsgD family transcriptional regulator
MDAELSQQVREMLEAGFLRREVADRLGVSPSTVTRYARILGFPDARTRPSPRDWSQVQRYYDEGHTIDECKERFGFSYGAWDKAVTRGDITPRPRADRQLARSTRDEVEHLLAQGLTQAEIGRRLKLTKSTVAYHVRGLGIRADPRFARRLDWVAIQRAIDEEGLSRKQCLERFGLAGDTWYRAVLRGDLVPPEPKMPVDQLFVAGHRRQRGHLKGRLLNEGLKENRCEICGISEWQGKPLNMQLHHKNGDGHDNRLENLELLCANCHSQTDTYGGRNGHRRPGATRDERNASDV